MIKKTKTAKRQNRISAFCLRSQTLKHSALSAQEESNSRLQVPKLATRGIPPVYVTIAWLPGFASDFPFLWNDEDWKNVTDACI